MLSLTAEVSLPFAYDSALSEYKISQGVNGNEQRGKGPDCKILK